MDGSSSGATDDLDIYSWKRMQEKMKQVGFREGASQGHDAAFQEGFDKGYIHGFNTGVSAGCAKGTLIALKKLGKEDTLLVENATILEDPVQCQMCQSGKFEENLNKR